MQLSLPIRTTAEEFQVNRCTIGAWLSNYASVIHVDLFFFNHWAWVAYICVNKLTIIGSDDGLSPGERQAIIWSYAGILLIGPIGTNS